MERKRQAQHRDRAALRGGPARDPSARRATAYDQRQALQLAVPQMLHDRDPGRVELPRRRGRPPPSHSVRLLD
jgi:hypothetical protein